MQEQVARGPLRAEEVAEVEDVALVVPVEVLRPVGALQQWRVARIMYVWKAI